MVGLVSAAASEPRAARMVRALATHEVVARVAQSLGVDDGEMRASLAASQVIGLVMARHVVGVEPLASLPADALVAALAPNLQRYLTEPLDRPDADAGDGP
jgi:hypothetical protein